jgi:hypothetical protein
MKERKNGEYIHHIQDLAKELADILGYLPSNFRSHSLSEMLKGQRSNGEIIEEFGCDTIDTVIIEGVEYPGRILTFADLAPLISDTEKPQPNNWSLTLDCTNETPRLINLKSNERLTEEKEENRSYKFDPSETLETDLALLAQNQKAVRLLEHLINSLRIIAEAQQFELSDPKIDASDRRDRRVTMGEQKSGYNPSVIRDLEEDVASRKKIPLSEKIKTFFRKT